MAFIPSKTTRDAMTIRRGVSRGRPLGWGMGLRRIAMTLSDLRVRHRRDPYG